MKIFHTLNNGMEQFSLWVTKWTGSTPGFVLSVVLILGWLLTGPFYGYSDSWQLIANTVTTIIEFVMVFVLQRALNKETEATQLKLGLIMAKLDSLSVCTVESKEAKS
jgi:low affinity Fe/Cu permease